MTARPDARLNCFAWESENAAQLAEFAITLPLLVVFVVGIFDFSGAFTLKQKLTNIARDAARAAAADPATDLRSALPYSVSDAFYVVDNYLLANNINDCGLGLQTPTLVTGHPLTWQVTISSSSGSPCGIILTINRGYYFPIATPVTTPPALTCTPAAANGAVQVVGTCVSIQYFLPVALWKGCEFVGQQRDATPHITAEAVAMNEN